MRKAEEDVAASERLLVVVAHGFLLAVVKDARSSLCCSFREDISDAIRGIEDIRQGDLKRSIDALKSDGDSAYTSYGGLSFANSNS